ncbi:hypothetical protein MFM001_32090 [Mycobacterium sp. MFM001]|nr:hypothetical protein MFM001_32090 [Mycobacterium sp. MFM001]
MPEDAQMSLPDTGVWRVATWFVPVTVQVVLALSAGAMWVLSKGPLGGRDSFGSLVLTGATVGTAISLLAGGYLARSKEPPRRRAIGMSIAGAGIAVFVGAAAYALWLLPWLEPGD